MTSLTHLQEIRGGLPSAEQVRQWYIPLARHRPPPTLSHISNIPKKAAGGGFRHPLHYYKLLPRRLYVLIFEHCYRDRAKPER